MDIPPPSDEKGEALIVVIGTERALPPLRCSALPVPVRAARGREGSITGDCRAHYCAYPFAPFLFSSLLLL